MKGLGSMFAGIGGLDLAVEWTFEASSVWQLDIAAERVRSRHWPNTAQVVLDVERLSDGDGDLTARGRRRIEGLGPIDILAAGFSCQDLSVAGSHSGFGGKKTGPTYRATLQFVEVLRPGVVVLENVPQLLTQHRSKVEQDMGAIGYACTWIRARAGDAGAPHLRRRVFVVCERDQEVGLGVLDASREAAGVIRPWPTPIAADSRGVLAHGPGPGAGEPLNQAVRPWPTPTASNPNEQEDPENFRRRSEGLVERGSRPLSEPLGQAVRNWATPAATDFKSATEGQRKGQLGDQTEGSRLNPEWVETLMGFPIGWTDRASWQLGLFAPRAHRLQAVEFPRWPRGRYPKGWDRSGRWDGFSWEPPRTLPDGRPVPGRPDRLRELGNAVCPQQGRIALLTWLAARRTS